MLKFSPIVLQFSSISNVCLSLFASFCTPVPIRSLVVSGNVIFSCTKTSQEIYILAITQAVDKLPGKYTAFGLAAVNARAGTCSPARHIHSLTAGFGGAEGTGRVSLLSPAVDTSSEARRLAAALVWLSLTPRRAPAACSKPLK